MRRPEKWQKRWRQKNRAREIVASDARFRGRVFSCNFSSCNSHACLLWGFRLHVFHFALGSKEFVVLDTRGWLFQNDMDTFAHADPIRLCTAGRPPNERCAAAVLTYRSWVFVLISVQLTASSLPDASPSRVVARSGHRDHAQGREVRGE